MKALTIKQPWAQLVMKGGKDIENREWPCHYRGHIAITASAKIDKAEVFSACDFMKSWIPKFSTRIFMDEAMRHPVGCALGTVEIYGCVTDSDRPWFQGRYGFLLRDPRPLATPIPIKGKLGLWELPEDIEQRVVAELGLHL